MRSLREPQTAVLDVRDPSSAKLEFEQTGVMSGSDEHGLFFQEDPLLSVGKDLVADFVRLSVFVEATYEAGPGTAIPTCRPENRREPLLGFCADSVRHIEDLLARSVAVEVQYNGPGTRKDLFEVQYVANAVGAEAKEGFSAVGAARRDSGAWPRLVSCFDEDART